jgi:hypothetical protein
MSLGKRSRSMACTAYIITTNNSVPTPYLSKCDTSFSMGKKLLRKALPWRASYLDLSRLQERLIAILGRKCFKLEAGRHLNSKTSEIRAKEG